MSEIQWFEELEAARSHAGEHEKVVLTYIHAPG